jgi:plastocyanin
MHTRLLAARSLLGLAAITAIACGGSSSSSNSPTPTSPGFFITISNMSFSPLNLHVPPGGTVTVINDDGITHSVTSESTPNAFAPGAVGGVSFDTGLFSGGQKSFTIPATAANGTVIPYFCMSHKQLMNTPTGTITVDTSAGATTPPPSGGGGMGGGY